MHLRRLCGGGRGKAHCTCRRTEGLGVGSRAVLVPADPVKEKEGAEAGWGGVGFEVGAVEELEGAESGCGGVGFEVGAVEEMVFAPVEVAR
jgi:hypothetical protein